jgi:hypothetical protein
MTMTAQIERAAAAAGRAAPSADRQWRTAAASGLVAVAVLHLAAAPPEWGDARMVFWLFVALAAACLVLAARLARGLDRWAWAAVLALAAIPMAGYVVSRATGFPGDTEDVGDWANPLGLAALAVEAALVTLAVLRRRPGVAWR